MIGTISVEIQAANPSMPLFPLRAFINSPTSLRIRNVPKKIGDWSITKVYVSAAYPDNSIQSTECVLVGGVWVGTIAGSSMAGKGGDGYTVYADGIDENGEPVAGYILGKGQVEILTTDTISPGVVQYYVHLLEDGDVERHFDGDLWKDAETGAWLIWQDGQAWAVGDDTGLIDELKERVDALDSTTSELSVDVADLNVAMEGVGERLDVIDSTVSGLVDELDAVDGTVSALESDVEQIDSSVSELQANVQTLDAELDTKADKVKIEPVLVYMAVPDTIQPIYQQTNVLNLNQTLMDADTQHRVWWFRERQFEDKFGGISYESAWVVYDPTDDSFKSCYFMGGSRSGEFPPPSVTWNPINGIDNGVPRTDGRPQTGYDTWAEFFDASSPAAVYIANASKWMYGKVNMRVKPSTMTYNVIYEDDMNETLEDYAPLQKHMSYEGDVLVPNQIDSAWVSVDPVMARLGLNASYMSQDTQKRVWWSSQVQYEPEPSTILYIYVVACYDATNDTFKANVWRDEQSGLPQNISDLGDTDEWGSFSRASGWASWRDFFYNAPTDEYEVSYGQSAHIDLFDHTFVKARWGGLFDVVYEGELVNAYATRQYVDEQIGNILTEEF